MRPLNLGFVQDAVRSQVSASSTILETARRLQSLAASDKLDDGSKEQIQLAIDELASTARDLAESATKTGQIVTQFVSRAQAA